MLGVVELPRAPLLLKESFGSGLSRRQSDAPGIVWATGDRGPNLKIKTLLDCYGAQHLAELGSVKGAKIMPRTDIGPRIAQLKVNGAAVELVQSLLVEDSDGVPVSGLPMPGSEHTISEPVFDLEGSSLAADPSGLDSEGLHALEDGTFFLSEEFGPSLVHLGGDGRVLARYVPEGAVLDGARYPVRETLPAIAGRRQLNRGFEAIAGTPDQKWLYVAFQSPLAHPDEEAHAQARHVRLWRLEISSMRVVSQFLYLLDPPSSFVRDCAIGTVDASDLKVSEMVCLPSGKLLVLERASHTTKIYIVTPSEELALDEEHLQTGTRPTVEQLSASNTPLPHLQKELLFSSDDAPEVSPDLEGMAVLSPQEILLVNDNDYGVEGAETVFWNLLLAEPILG